nr:hypothetical protein [Candidatus Sigynarchaeota archaeon]
MKITDSRSKLQFEDLMDGIVEGIAGDRRLLRADPGSEIFSGRVRNRLEFLLANLPDGEIVCDDGMFEEFKEEKEKVPAKHYDGMID